MNTKTRWDNLAGFLLQAGVIIALACGICEGLFALTGYRPRALIWLATAVIIAQDAWRRFGRGR